MQCSFNATRQKRSRISQDNTIELVQELVGKTKRRSTKEKNGEKNMFSDLLYCADCGSKLWYHVK